MSVREVKYARVVRELGTPELVASVERDEVALHNAAVIAKDCSPKKQRALAEEGGDALFREAQATRAKQEAARKNAEIESQPLIIPEGRFSVIVIDPPWPLEKVAAGLYARDEEPVLPYPTMSVEQIRDWGLEPKRFFPDQRTAPSAHLFLWCPDHFLKDARWLLGEWGFEYSRTFVWHKNTAQYFPGMPGYNCEFVLHGRRGSPRFREIAGAEFTTCFDGVNQGHSRKPVEFYEMIRKVTDGPRVDVFSRSAHEGFEACGNEVDKFLPAPAANSMEAALGL